MPEGLPPTALATAYHFLNDTEVQPNKGPKMGTKGLATAISKVLTGMQGPCALTSFDIELEPVITTESRVSGLLWALPSLHAIKSMGTPPPACQDAAKERLGQD